MENYKKMINNILTKMRNYTRKNNAFFNFQQV